MSPSTKKVAIVTGGVGGIGEELTRTLIKKGWQVIALDVPSQSSLAENLSKEFGDSFEFMSCDVSSYSELARCFSETFNKRERIDAFCSNAGIVDKSSIYIFSNRGQIEIPPEPDLSCTDVCFKALIYGTQLSIHFMRQNPSPGGFIVATSSCVGLYPIASFPEYCGAKAAINHFVRASAPILKLHENITINAVCPGTVPTRHISQDMRNILGHEYLTPKSTPVAAYIRFLEDPSLTGELVEASRDKVLHVEKPKFADGEVSKRVSQVFDPFFKAVHGEVSGLADIIR